MTTVIIPARNEQYLQKTIENVLFNADGEIEIIAICDGYWADPPIKDHPYVRIIHNTEARGQRQSINDACKIARGKFIMKLDAHCAVAKGFNTILERDCEYDMTMIPRMYNLDVLTWKPKLHKRTDYMYISSLDDEKPFRASYYGKKQPKNDKMIDDIMCCMGPCFFMHKKRFWELDGCDEEHGHWGQQGIELACKAWLSGGRLVVNKNTWFAHWFRGGGVPEGHKKGFPYPMKQAQVEKARKHSQELWLENKWHKAKRPFQFMVDKFAPPGWDIKNLENKTMNNEIKKEYYKWMISGGKMPIWMGTPIVKYPGDILKYQEVIYEKKPDVIIESGTYKGGSALFFAHIMELMGHGEVITIDIKDHDAPKHPRITHIINRATDQTNLENIKEMVKGKTVMVVLDSNHHRSHVKRELIKYQDIVTPGQYMVVEDTNYKEIGKKDGPDEAVEWFMKKTKKFKQESLGDKFLFTLNPKGWLLRQ